MAFNYKRESRKLIMKLLCLLFMLSQSIVLAEKIEFQAKVVKAGLNCYVEDIAEKV